MPIPIELIMAVIEDDYEGCEDYLDEMDDDELEEILYDDYYMDEDDFDF